MVDFTEINFDIIPEVSLLHSECVVLKKSNKALTIILASAGLLLVGFGIIYLYKKQKDDT